MIIHENFGNSEIIEIGEKTKIIKDFKPYFYIKDEKGKYISIFGDKLKKIFCNSPREVKYKREKYEHFEADILFSQRYIIDKLNLPLKKIDLNIIYFDIENLMSLDVINTPKPIISIACYSTKIKKYVIFIWRKDLNNEKIEKLETDIYKFNDEKLMIKKFVSYIKEINPHIISGWNNDLFDFPYLINRMKLLNLNPTELSKTKYINIDLKYKKCIIGGRISFDMLKAWKILQPNKLPNNRLNTVAKNILGEEKIDIDIINDYENNIEKLISYNIKDVRILVKLEEKIGLIEFFDERRREFGVIWNNLWFTSGVHDAVLLKQAKEDNIILPSKKINENKKIKGATVIQPTPGIYKGVLCLDVKSLYPSLICQFNMSPETLGGNDIKLSNNISFTKEKEGFIVKIIKKYFKKRNFYKKKMLECEPNSSEYNTYFLKQYNYKIMLNSLYGYIAFPKSRLYCRDMGRSITYMGRKTIEFMKNICEELGYKIIYGDTDSIHILIDNIDKNFLIEKGNEISNIINKKFDEFVKQFGCVKNDYLEVEFEKVFNSIFFGFNELKVSGERIASKKRYVYHEIWRDGKDVNNIEFVGFEVRRSDQSEITKMIQRNIMKMILLENKDKKFIIEYINKIKCDIKNKKFNLEYIGIPGYLNKKKNIIRGCKYSNNFLDLNIQNGDRIFLLYGTIIGFPITDVFCFKKEDDLKDYNIKIDWEKMFDLMIDKKIDRIFSALKWDDESNQKQFQNFI